MAAQERAQDPGQFFCVFTRASARPPWGLELHTDGGSSLQHT